MMENFCNNPCGSLGKPLLECGSSLNLVPKDDDDENNSVVTWYKDYDSLHMH